MPGALRIGLPAMAALLLSPEAAFAAPLTCNGSGGVAGGEMIPSDTGLCAFTGLDHIFSWIMCNFVLIINNVMGRMYCGMQYVLLSALGAVFTLYIVVFGVQILMGTTQLNVKEIFVRMMKIAGVFMFVSYSTYGIDMVYTFFTGGMAYAVFWVMNAVPTGIVATDPLNPVSPVFAYLDQMVFNSTLGAVGPANVKVLGIFAVLSYVAPPLFLMGLYWLWMNFTIMVRALISFLMSLTAIAFLIALSPIFLSFMLFQVTYYFFENWLKYMISYALQVVVIFACIAMWLMATSLLIDFFNKLSDVVYPYNGFETDLYTVSNPRETWGICPYNFNASGGPFGPTLVCKPGWDPNTWNNDGDITNDLIMDQKIPKEKDFIYFVVFHMLALIIIAYAFSALIRQAPQIAKQLAGPAYVPMLGQGWGFNRYGIAGGGKAAGLSHGQTGVRGHGRGALGGSAVLGAGKTAIKEFIAQSQKMLQRH